MRVAGFVMVDEAGQPLSVSVGGGADLIKSHVKGYTRKDGAFVKEHDDKRQASAAGADDHPTVVGRPSKMVSYKYQPGKGSAEAEAEHPADADAIDFAGKRYDWTGSTGRSNHDQTPVRAYEHEESGHKVWMDEQGRVHADDQTEVEALRAKAKAGDPAPKKKVAAVRKPKPKPEPAAAPSAEVKTKNESDGYHGEAMAQYMRDTHGEDGYHGDLSPDQSKAASDAAHKKFSDAAHSLVSGGHFGSHDEARDYLDSKHGRHLHDGATFHGGDISKVAWLGKDVAAYKKKAGAR